jgi:hypothetical protein
MFNRTLVSSFVAGVVVSLACNYLLISEPKSPPVEEINTLQNAYNAVRQNLIFWSDNLAPKSPAGYNWNLRWLNSTATKSSSTSLR